MSRTYLRGDLYYADLGSGIGSEQKGNRPVVIIQNNVGNKHSPTVIISCYNKFCSALALLSVTSESGYMVLSDMYALKQEVNPIKQVSTKILAAVDFAINRFAENFDVVLNQVKSASDAFFFQPSLSMATRGLSESGQSVFKVEDINDEKTFIAVDPVSSSLLIQINTKELGNIRIRAFLQLEGGDTIEIQLQQKGKIYKGQISDLPAERFKIVLGES